MMKIMNNNNTFILPLDNLVVLAVNNNNYHVFIQLLEQYFGKKRKLDILVYDDANETIEPKDIDIIHIPWNDKLSDITKKSVIGEDLIKVMESNSDMFRSVDLIRKGLRQLETDSGMYKITKILSCGLEDIVTLKSRGIEISSIVDFLSFDTEGSTDISIYLAILNLELYLHRNQYTLVILDCPINQQVIDWISYYLDSENIHFIGLIDNVENELEISYPTNLLSIGINEFIEEEYISGYELNLYLYLLNTFNINHMHFLDEKSQNIIKKVIRNDTFLYKYQPSNIQNS